MLLVHWNCRRCKRCWDSVIQGKAETRTWSHEVAICEECPFNVAEMKPGEWKPRPKARSRKA